MKITTSAAATLRQLAGMSKRVADLRPGLKVAGSYGVEVSKQAFRDHADPETKAAWTPLSPVYGAWKKRKGYDPLPLTKTGRLRRSVRRLSIGRNFVTYGTDVVYGAAHQFGSRNVPRRQFIGLSRDDRDEVARIIGNWVTRSEK